MRKLFPLIAALGTAFAVNSAQAMVFLVDDFNTPGVAVSGGDLIADGAGFANATVVANHALVGQVATNRLVYSNLLANPQSRPVPTTVTVGGGATGNLDIDNGAGVDATATIRWTMGAFVLPVGDTSLLFNVVFSNVGQPAADNMLNFTMTNGANVVQWTKLVGLPGSGAVDRTFALSAAEALALSQGGFLEMLVSGTSAFDLTIDQFSIRLPEPTSLALVGLALVGAGVAARRRKV